MISLGGRGMKASTIGWIAAGLAMMAASGPADAVQTSAAPTGAARVDRTCGFGTAAQAHGQARARLGVARGFSLETVRELEGEQTPGEGEIIEWLGRRIAAGTYPDGTHILFYSRQDRYLSTWLFGPQGIVACTVRPSVPQLEGQIGAYLAALEIHERQIARTARPIEGEEGRGAPVGPAAATADLPVGDAGRLLAQTLFPAEIRPALDGVRHLVIVPTGDLGAIPYAALSPWDDGSQIVDRFSLSIAPSLHSLAKDVPRWEPGQAFAQPLIVGDPRLPPTPGWLIPPLPGAEAEAREVAEMLNASAVIGPAATRAAVSDRAGEASLLYIATHGISNPDDPVDGGFLMLAAERFEAGWWTARAIQSSQLAARLAVLSACQTGLGQAHDGGMIGLARAFQVAGVPRVLMSLWNVDDEATRFLMVRFMRHARDTLPAEALRRAMLEARREFDHPALWASFLLFSEAG
jgi:hypothetical protein